MLHILTHNILPVFAVLALGFLMGRGGKATEDEARAANRLAFMVFQPALIFPLIANLDFASFDPLALAIYAVAEILAFGMGYFVARKIFHREHLESFLLGMAVVFVNSLLYIWPISFLIYGEAASLPITALVAWDASVSFAFFIISMELMAGNKATGNAVKRVTTNPVLIAIVLGVVVNLAGIPVPEPLETAFHFAGAAAAPLTLLALGIILSGSKLAPTGPIIGISALKLLVFPALVWAGLTMASTQSHWADLFILNAAGPSGMMAFALAMLYGVRNDVIAPVIIWTSILSLFSLALLA